jgi:hypothetical protein
MGKGWTYQSLIDGRMTVTAFCQNSACHHNQRLDLEALRDRFGPDAPAMEWDIRPKLRCQKCKGKEVGLIYAPDADKISGMGKSLYAKSKGQ